MVRLDIDTGSSDIIVKNSQLEKCQDDYRCGGSVYDPSLSSTFELVQEGNMSAYFGSGAYEGDYFSDELDLGGIKIPSLIMGYANELKDGSDGVGMFGISYQKNSQFANAYNGHEPETVISAMVKTGAIARQAYSIFLGSTKSGQGSIAFGGVDSSLYTGELVAVPIMLDANGKYAVTNVALTGISVNDLDGTRSLTMGHHIGMPAYVDTGFTQQKLPRFLVDQIFRGFGVSVIDGTAYLPCSRTHANVSLTYHFGGPNGPTINVPLSSLAPTYAYTDNGVDLCYVDMDPLGGNVALGDSFMRSGYFVFDLENNQIAMAQAATSPVVSDAQVTPIPSGTDIPGCTSTNTFSLDTTQLMDSYGFVGPSYTATSMSIIAPTFNLESTTTQIHSLVEVTTTQSTSTSKGAAPPTRTIILGRNRAGAVAAAVLAALI